MVKYINQIIFNLLYVLMMSENMLKTQHVEIQGFWKKVFIRIFSTIPTYNSIKNDFFQKLCR